jgi:hypothetical protein
MPRDAIGIFGIAESLEASRGPEINDRPGFVQMKPWLHFVIIPPIPRVEAIRHTFHENL